MKRIILILSMLICIYTNAQTSYPYYYIKGGDTLGVVISVKQAQKIDNDYDLIALLKVSNIEKDSINSAYIIVMNDYSIEVAELKLKISKMNEINSSKDSLIINLKSQIIQYNNDILLSNNQLKIKDSIINNYKTQTIKLKVQKMIGFSVGTLSLLGMIFLLILKK